MDHYRLDVHNILTGERVFTRQVSADSGYLYRHALVERYAEELEESMHDLYVVEYEVRDEKETILNKFQFPGTP